MNKEIDIFRENPHLFGHYLGYIDLIETHSEWIIDAWLKKDCKAMQAHRNSFKTSSIIIVGCIWYLLFYNPDVSILIVRKAQTESRKIITALKKHLDSTEVRHVASILYGIEDLKTSRWSSESITLSIKDKITPEGNIDCLGVGGSITGSHYDFIFPDDIITIRDRTSRAERETTKSFVMELKNIRKRGGKVFFSGTPWHKDDAWSILPEPKKYPIGTVDIIGFRKPELTETIQELRRGNTESLFSANYRLEHIADEERTFSDPEFIQWDYDWRDVTAYLDPAYSGTNTTALSIIAKFKTEGKADYCCTGFTWVENVIDIYHKIVEKLRKYNVGSLYVETNSDKGLSVRDLKTYHPIVQGINERENKHMKIIGYGKQHWNLIKFNADVQQEYLIQILDYKEGQEPDDAPDSFSSLLRQMGFSNRLTVKAPSVKKQRRHQKSRSTVSNLPR